MLDVQEALEIVLSEAQNYGTEKVPLQDCIGRILAEDVVTDRDSPPFDRVMMDGIAVQLGPIGHPLQKCYPIQGIQAAGMPPMTLKDRRNCLEVMTGAILPHETDTVIPYEAIRIENGRAYPLSSHAENRYLHYQGRDMQKGRRVLRKGKKINAGDVGILATVGKGMVEVARNPKVAVIATGNELVGVNEKPQRHQIRKSNVHVLLAALHQDGIKASSYHLLDDRNLLFENLPRLLATYDVLLISGGVSKGKYDLIPGALQALGVEKSFHGVAQRPGKPFWFGKHRDAQTKVFAFPGNPVSTFVGYHYYFRQWVWSNLGNSIQFPLKSLAAPVPGDEKLGLFMLATLNAKTNEADLLTNNGSGDLFSLARAQGLVFLPKNSGHDHHQPGFPFIPF